MAYTTINKSTDYFNTKLYTGNGSTQSITGVGFQPDWVWVKDRDVTHWNTLTDVVRGTTKVVYTNSANAEITLSNSITSFDSDGFTTGNEVKTNNNGDGFVSWNWLADNTSGSSNTDGSITSTVSANTTSRFSIVSYTGNGTSGATIGHGLGSKPAFILLKRLDTSENFVIGHHKFNSGNNPWNYFSKLRASGRGQTANTAIWNDTEPTSSVITLGNDTAVNGNGATYIAYVWSEVAGFSKFGEYRSNANSDGPFTYLGFKPKFLMIMNRDSDDEVEIYDSARNGYNDANYHLNANLNTTEDTSSGRLDLLSNGFKLRTAPSGPINSGTSGTKYLYFAWGQSLVGSNNVPCTAR